MAKVPLYFACRQVESSVAAPRVEGLTAGLAAWLTNDFDFTSLKKVHPFIKRMEIVMTI